MPNLKLLKNNLFLNFIFILTIFGLDRISKVYVVEQFKKNFYNGLTFIIILVSILILYIAYKNIGLQKYALLSIFAGSLGNIYDRIFNRAVPDFLDLHIEEFHWFIFNIADIFITLGVIIMIMTEFFSNNKENKFNDKS